MISLDRNDRKVMSLSCALPGLHLNILKAEKMLQFWDERFSTCVARHSKRKRLKRFRDEFEREEFFDSDRIQRSVTTAQFENRLSEGNENMIFGNSLI